MRRRQPPLVLPSILLFALLPGGCGGDGDDTADAADADGTDDVVGPTVDADLAAPDAAAGDPLDSTLTATCATLQGRAIVNENGDLGVSFTEADLPYTFIGSIQWDLPDGFTGQVPNPEDWDGESARQIVAVTSPGFELFGNHCWLDGPPPAQPGTATIAEFDLAAGVVRATFDDFVLRSCTTPTTCTVNGTIETTGEGVFE